MLAAFVFVPPALIVVVAHARSVLLKRVAITFICAAYGATMKLGPSADGTRHLARLDWHYAGLDFQAFVGELWEIITFQYNPSGVQDVFLHVVSYCTSSVLNMPELFFPLIGAFFGWFFGGALLIALRGLDARKLNYVLLYFAALLIMMRGINQMQAVRMWTGMWLMVYGVLAYAQTRRPIHLVQIMASPLIHISYFVIVPVALLGLAARKRRQLIVLAFFATTFFSIALSPSIMVGVEGTQLGEHYAYGYLSDEPREEFVGDVSSRLARTSWYNALTRAGVPNYGFLILAFTLIVTGKYGAMPRPARDVMSVALMLLIFSNVTGLIPELSGRSRLIAANLLVAAFLMSRLGASKSGSYAGPNIGLYRVGVNLSLVLTLPLLLFSLSSLTDHLSIYLFMLPFIAFFVPEANMSVKGFLTSLM